MNYRRPRSRLADRVCEFADVACAALAPPPICPSRTAVVPCLHRSGHNMGKGRSPQSRANCCKALDSTSLMSTQSLTDNYSNHGKSSDCKVLITKTESSRAVS